MSVLTGRAVKHRTRRVAMTLAMTVQSSLTAFAGACGGESAPDTMNMADTPVTDTATLGAQALAIAGFALDTVREAPWVARLSAPARVILNPEREQLLGSIVEGRVTQVMVRVGDAVRAGDVLVSIHSHEIMDARSGIVRAESDLRTAQAERDAAKLALERAQRLLSAKAIGQAALEQALVTATSAQANAEAAEAEAVRARGLIEHLLGEGPLPENLDPHDVLIRAPIGGMVVDRAVVPGTVVLPGDPLVSVADPKALQLELRLTDRQVAGITRGTQLTFTLVGETGGTEDVSTGRAVVARVSPVADDATRTTMVIAEIEYAPAGTRAERFATAQLMASTTANASPRVVRVPVTAVQSIAGDTVVIVAEQRGEGLHIEAVAVRVGRRDGAFAEVLAGVKAGQVVITRGATIARAELLKRREGAGGE